MCILKYNNIKDDLIQLRNGSHSRWGFLPGAAVIKALIIGKWEVDIYGNICYDSHYSITTDRLEEKDWIIHLMNKYWFDFNEFMPIYLQACTNAKIKEITIRINY